MVIGVDIINQLAICCVIIIVFCLMLSIIIVIRTVYDRLAAFLIKGTSLKVWYEC